MGDDRTVLKKGKPKYAINEVAYARTSATRGFVEPLHIDGVSFDPGKNDWLYSWRIGRASEARVSPIQVYESELVTLCEALTIQISVLKREYADLQEQMRRTCPNGPIASPAPAVPVITIGKIQPPAPRFGINDVVYLKESAESVGRLESYRITDLSWGSEFQEWKYIMLIKPRPGRNMTVGDRDDKNHSFEIWYPESQLATVCEALPLAMSFMQRAVSMAEARLRTYCGGTT